MQQSDALEVVGILLLPDAKEKHSHFVFLGLAARFGDGALVLLPTSERLPEGIGLTAPVPPSTPAP